jgi:N-acetylmuramoyl-L-alanine amidase
MTRVAIEVSSDFKFHADRLTNPDRLFFDIKGARPAMAEKQMHIIEVGDSLVRKIRIAEVQPGTTRVVLDLEDHSPVAEYTTTQLSNPDRLVVEVKLKDTPEPPATSLTAAKRVRAAPVAPIEPDLLTRVVTNNPLPVLAPPVPVFAPPVVETLPKPKARAFVAPPEHPTPKFARTFEPISTPSMTIAARPAIHLYPKSGTGIWPGTEYVAPKLTAKTTERPSPAAPSVSPAASEPAPLAAKRNSTGDRSLTRALGLKLGKVVLDPGHGGTDVGTQGPSGYYEKDLVLDVALRLGALITERMGSEVVYTRDDDRFIPLEQRTRIANEHKADLFLSIHANSSNVRNVSGVETYYLNFTTSKTALDLAARENAGSGHTIYDLKELLQKIALKDKVDESREFANRIQSSLYTISAKTNANSQDRGLKRAPFVVLIGASMPSVLAEIGFLTNPADESLLKKEEHRQKIAEALYKGIASYAETLSHFTVAQGR